MLSTIIKLIAKAIGGRESEAGAIKLATLALCSKLCKFVKADGLAADLAEQKDLAMRKKRALTEEVEQRARKAKAGATKAEAQADQERTKADQLAFKQATEAANKRTRQRRNEVLLEKDEDARKLAAAKSDKARTLLLEAQSKRDAERKKQAEERLRSALTDLKMEGGALFIDTKAVEQVIKDEPEAEPLAEPTKRQSRPKNKVDTQSTEPSATKKPRAKRKK